MALIWGACSFTALADDASSTQETKVKYPNHGYRGSIEVTYAASSGIMDKDLILQAQKMASRR